MVPRFLPARKVQYAWQEKSGKELYRLQAESIIEPVRHAEWAAPIVPVLKEDGTLRIRGDYKKTVNKACKIDVYPLPKVEDMFAQLAEVHKD